MAKTLRARGPSGDPPFVRSLVTDEERLSRRRGQIIPAAVELFSERGYDRTTIQDIARKAGVSIGLIYQYTQRKEDILLLAIVSVMETYKQRIPEAAAGRTDPLDVLWASLAAYCRVVDEARDAATLAYRSTKSLPHEHRQFLKQAELETNAFITRALRGCIRAGLFREVDVELVTYQLVLYVHTWALKHWRLSQITDVEGYIAQGFDFFVRAMATPRGLQKYAEFPADGGERRRRPVAPRSGEPSPPGPKDREEVR